MGIVNSYNCYLRMVLSPYSRSSKNMRYAYSINVHITVFIVKVTKLLCVTEPGKSILAAHESRFDFSPQTQKLHEHTTVRDSQA